MIVPTLPCCFLQAADGIHEPTEETQKQREAAKPALLSNKPVRKMTKVEVEGILCR